MNYDILMAFGLESKDITDFNITDEVIESEGGISYLTGEEFGLELKIGKEYTGRYILEIFINESWERFEVFQSAEEARSFAENEFQNASEALTETASNILDLLEDYNDADINIEELALKSNIRLESFIFAIGELEDKKYLGTHNFEQLYSDYKNTHPEAQLLSGDDWDPFEDESEESLASDQDITSHKVYSVLESAGITSKIRMNGKVEFEIDRFKYEITVESEEKYLNILTWYDLTDEINLSEKIKVISFLGANIGFAKIEMDDFSAIASYEYSFANGLNVKDFLDTFNNFHTSNKICLEDPRIAQYVLH